MPRYLLTEFIKAEIRFKCLGTSWVHSEVYEDEIWQRWEQKEFALKFALKTRNFNLKIYSLFAL